MAPTTRWRNSNDSENRMETWSSCHNVRKVTSDFVWNNHGSITEPWVQHSRVSISVKVYRLLIKRAKSTSGYFVSCKNKIEDVFPTNSKYFKTDIKKICSWKHWGVTFDWQMLWWFQPLLAECVTTSVFLKGGPESDFLGCCRATFKHRVFKFEKCSRLSLFC